MPDQGSADILSSGIFRSVDDALRVTAEIYTKALAPEPWEAILSLLARRVGTTKAALVSVDTVHPSESRSFIVGVDPALAEVFQKRNLARDYLFQALRRLPEGSVALGSEVLTDELTRSAPLWDAIAVPGGLQYRLCAMLENRPHQYTSLALMRSEAEFTCPEKEFLRGLVPHLQAAVMTNRRLQQAEAGRRELIRRFDYTRQALVILDRSGYALFVNKTATALLDQADGVALKFGRFVFNDVAMQAKLEAAVRQALTENAAPDPPLRTEISVSRTSGGAPYELSVVAIRRPSHRALLPDRPGCLVLIDDPTAPHPSSPDRLVRLYGLTSAEARVCEALVAVGSVNEVAEMLHITPNTTRGHLKSVYSKMRVANQAQLMQRLTAMARPQTATDVIGAGIPGAS